MFTYPKTVAEIAQLISAEIQGNSALEISALASLDKAQPGELSFASDDKRVAGMSSSRASAVIVASSAQVETDKCLLKVADVGLAMNKLLLAMNGHEDVPPVGIDPTAIVHPEAEVSPNAAIGPFVRIGAGAKIGAGTSLCTGVKIGKNVQIGNHCMFSEGVVVRYNCIIGNGVRIGPNSVVGYDGFGYHFAGGIHHKVPHAGNVYIQDDVELGACVCVDRAKWGSTTIGCGAKIDNLVQIAHNVQIGAGCVLVSQVGIAGSTELGKYVVLGGQVGIRDNIEVGAGTEIAACSCLANSVGPGERLLGVPAKDARTRLKEIMAETKLPSLLRQVKKLEARVAELEADAKK